MLDRDRHRTVGGTPRLGRRPPARRRRHRGRARGARGPRRRRERRAGVPLGIVRVLQRSRRQRLGRAAAPATRLIAPRRFARTRGG